MEGLRSHLTQPLHFTVEKTDVYKGAIVSQILTGLITKLSMKLISDEARRALSRLPGRRGRRGRRGAADVS